MSGADKTPPNLDETQQFVPAPADSHDDVVSDQAGTADDARRSTQQPARLYRCICGKGVELASNPDRCPVCQREIGSDAPADLSLTMTIHADTPAVIDDRQPKKNDELIGKMLGHFEILELLGSGGMGQVYRALDTSLQRYVAVKLIRDRRRVPDERTSARLLQEAVAQARVNHPHVVTIFYVGRHENDPFLAMELVGTRSVADLLKSGPIPYQQTATIAAQITDALAKSCEMGIIHGDIKPNNILLDGEDAKLSDFGMSRMVGENQNESVLGGTPNYLAPELLAGATPTIQSDMYALGVTFFEMTFGRLPVQLSGISVSDWAKIHQTAEIVFPEVALDQVPALWLRILRRLLHKDPANRYPDYASLQADLRRVMPMRSKPARAIPRAMAWMLDVMLVSLFMIPFAFASQMLSPVTNLGWILKELSLGISQLIPVFIYFLLLVSWRQSVGRFLMSIRVVNQQNLPAPRLRLVLRDLLRLSPLWVSVIMQVTHMDGTWASGVITAATVLLLGVSCVAGFFSRASKTLLDRFFKTRVVIDMN